MGVKPEEKKYFKSRDSVHVWGEGHGRCKCGTLVLSHALWLNHLEHVEHSARAFPSTNVPVTAKDLCASDDRAPEGELWPKPLPEPAINLPSSDFVIKDSGQRQEFSSGMVRDVTADKTNVALVFDGPMFWRWAVHLTKGAIKYAKRNWMKATGEEEYERFRESAARHFAQWYNGDTDEDHASAVFFNINGAEYVKGRKQ